LNQTQQIAPGPFQLFEEKTINDECNNTHFTWAVSEGDIAEVPEPSSILLFGFLYPLLSWFKKFSLSNKKI
jgi:hypothetical protein